MPNTKLGRRGRSKTKKLCLSSDPQTTTSESNISKGQPQTSGTPRGAYQSKWMASDHQLSSTQIPTQTSISSSHAQVQTPNRVTPGHRTPGDGVTNRRKLNRIKSLSKIEIRSPIVRKATSSFGKQVAHTADNTPSHTPLLGPSDLHESESLRTINTNPSLSSRLMGIVLPESFYTLRNYYNDFTTIDWVQAFIATNRFNYEVLQRNWIVDYDETDSFSEATAPPVRLKIPFYYKAYLVLGKWALIVIIGFLFSLIAFFIDKIEILLVGFKHGYCKSNWFASQISCCISPDLKEKSLSTVYLNVFRSGAVARTRMSDPDTCSEWVTWSEFFKNNTLHKAIPVDFLIYVSLTILLAYLACVITLTTRITSYLSGITSNGNIVGSDARNGKHTSESSFHSSSSSDDTSDHNVHARVIYTASGSGVPEVKTILSGFFIRRFLGTYTLFAKTITLILAIASGMALGKEGPYVHLATCVGNIMSRFFPYINNNDLMKKQILSASASSGVALAFGSPLGGVLFILEEINNYLPSHQLFQVFFCAIISTLFLKFLNPYGTGKTVLFELEYNSDWQPIELVFFILIGICGGIFGAAFVKFIHWWTKNFRSLSFIKDKPIFEVCCISLLTGVVTFWNPYTKQAAAELVLDLATPCPKFVTGTLNLALCPQTESMYIHELKSLTFALITKIVLTFVTFGLKLPCGIYVPSMVIGSLFGRITGMLLSLMNYKVDLGIYSMISAGAFMAGVTRMNITLVTILFELTSSYTYVLPIAIAIAVANWMGSILETNSLYESLLILNDYPFMSSETEPLDPMITAGDIINESDTYKLMGNRMVLDDDDNNRNFKKLWSEPGTTSSMMEMARSPINYVDALSSTRGLNKPSSGATSPLLNVGMVNYNEYSPLDDLNNNNDNRKLYIDVTNSPYVSASILQSKLVLLAEKSLLDGCIPLVMNDICVGLIFFAELEYCLDKLETFVQQYSITEEIFCKLLPDEKFYQTNVPNENIQMVLRHNHTIVTTAIQNHFAVAPMDYFSYRSTENHPEENFNDDFIQIFYELINLTDSIDTNPIFINHDSELTLAHLIFDKIGNRVIVLLKDGKYYGVLHKKVLIDYCRQEESS